MEYIYLSRRNLESLLSKLDRQAVGQETFCAIIKNDHNHPTHPQTIPQVMVMAVEDKDYYTDREPGLVHPKDEPIRGYN